MEKYTQDDSKTELYRQDLNYRLAEEMLMNNGMLSVEELYDYTFLVLHPEVFAGHFHEIVVDKLIEAGASIAGIDVIPFSLDKAKGIWKYQWNAATVERMSLFGLKSGLFSTAVIYIKRCAKTHGIPATLSLHELKGSSRFRERIRPHHFRSVLPFNNRALTFIHCPDEPADFLRELSIISPQENWLSIIHQLRTETLGRDDAINCLKSLCHESSFSDFDICDEKHIELWNSYMTLSSRVEARAVYESLPFIEKWKALSSAANHIQHDLENQPPIITTRHMPEVVQSWREMEWS